MNILCTICMRANSQEIKNKNLTIINGKPLMYYTINAAIKSKIFDEIIVSSDSKKIQREAKKLGAKVIFSRPKNLSSNDVPKLKANISLPDFNLSKILYSLPKESDKPPSRISFEPTLLIENKLL